MLSWRNFLQGKEKIQGNLVTLEMISHNVGYRAEKLAQREQHGIDPAPTTGPSEN